MYVIRYVNVFYAMLYYIIYISLKYLHYSTYVISILNYYVYYSIHFILSTYIIYIILHMLYLYYIKFRSPLEERSARYPPGAPIPLPLGALLNMCISLSLYIYNICIHTYTIWWSDSEGTKGPFGKGPFGKKGRRQRGSKHNETYRTPIYTCIYIYIWNVYT